MYYINKIIGVSLNPMSLAFISLFVGWFGGMRGHRKLAVWTIGLSLVWLWMWSAPIMIWGVGSPLESEFLEDGRVPNVETFHVVDAIVLLGGGTGIDTNLSVYAEMSGCADRDWQAARLYKTGRAPKIIATGFYPEDSTLPLLKDFGVPAESVVTLRARNTEEEAKVVREYFTRLNADGQSTAARGGDATVEREERQASKHKILLVTSAWHMKRARLMFKKYAPEVEVVCAPADFENTRAVQSFGLDALLPSANTLALNSATLHEWIGLVGYKLFR